MKRSSSPHTTPAVLLVMRGTGSYKFTDDGSMMAFARGDKGSDWRTIYIMDVASGRLLDDRLHHAK